MFFEQSLPDEEIRGFGVVIITGELGSERGNRVGGWEIKFSRGGLMQFMGLVIGLRSGGLTFIRILIVVFCPRGRFRSLF